MDDLISREELTKRIEAYFDGLPIQVHYDMLALAQKLPSAQPERKKGRWEIKTGELAIWDICSECKKMVLHKAPFYNFCPNCGSDMMAEQDERYDQKEGEQE